MNHEPQNREHTIHDGAFATSELNAKAQVMDWYRHRRNSSAAHVRLLVKMEDTSNLTINIVALDMGRYGKKAAESTEYRSLSA